MPGKFECTAYSGKFDDDMSTRMRDPFRILQATSQVSMTISTTLFGVYVILSGDPFL